MDITTKGGILEATLEGSFIRILTFFILADAPEALVEKWADSLYRDETHGVKSERHVTCRVWVMANVVAMSVGD